MNADPSQTLCLIPAKGGSTRLARKNLAMLGDKPLIAWAGEAARDSGAVDRVIVSTDDDEIAEAARTHGIDVPFMRPAALARDPAGVQEVALHALDEVDPEGAIYRTLVILLPTAPFRTSDDILAAHELYRRRGATALMSVAEYDHTPFAAMAISEGDLLTPHFPDYFELKSQDHPRAYRPNGAIHILDVATFRATRSYTAPPVVAYVMPRARSIDIDREEDLALARVLIAAADGRPAA